MIPNVVGPAGIESVLAALQETPRRISSLTTGIDPGWLDRRSRAGEWSPAEILAHLRSCADVWSYSMYAMLAVSEPHLADIHPRAWARASAYRRMPFITSFPAYVLQRVELLQALRPLKQSDWERGALIGRRRHTVFSQARRMALHEADHLEQIAQALSGA